MIEDIFVGSIHPKVNMRSSVSGKIFGPTAPQRMGYQVIVTRNGKRNVFPVASREEVDQVVNKAKEAEKVLEMQK